MAVEVTAEEVGQIVTYVAPGFFAQRAYAGRFPRPEPSEFTLLLWSVVLSLPIVALTLAVGPLLGIDEADPTDLGYVALLLAIAILGGYLVASMRARPEVRRALAAAGFSYQPESSVYAQALLSLPADAAVTVEFDDGRKLSGTPSMGPAMSDDAARELVITHPAWWDSATEQWAEQGAGAAVIVPLEHVHSVTLDRAPGD